MISFGLYAQGTPLSRPIMFFLRCAFWLTIVYASMSWAPGALSPTRVGSSLVEAGRSHAEALVTSAAASATDLCVRHPAECLADAARLSSLVDATQHDDASDADRPGPTVATIPMPVPDPRRRIRDAKLARAP